MSLRTLTGTSVPAIAEHEERGRADHRAVVGAEPRRRHAQRMSDALLDLGAQREIRRDAAAEQHGLRTANSAAARAVFSARISVIAFWNDAATSATGTSPFASSERTRRSDRGLEPGEREVVAVAKPGARQRERGGVAVLRGTLDHGSAGKAEAEETRDLVERFAGGVVDRAAERTEATVAFHEHEIAVGAAHDEHHGRELWLRRRRRRPRRASSRRRAPRDDSPR